MHPCKAQALTSSSFNGSSSGRIDFFEIIHLTNSSKYISLPRTTIYRFFAKFFFLMEIYATIVAWCHGRRKGLTLLQAMAVPLLNNKLITLPSNKVINSSFLEGLKLLYIRVTYRRQFSLQNTRSSSLVPVKPKAPVKIAGFMIWGRLLKLSMAAKAFISQQSAPKYMRSQNRGR